MPLTDSQAMKLVVVGVLFGCAAEVLADFERQLVEDVCRRFVELRREAHVTEHEWPVIERAMVAMRAEVAEQMAAIGIEAA